MRYAAATGRDYRVIPVHVGRGDKKIQAFVVRDERIGGPFHPVERLVKQPGHQVAVEHPGVLVPRQADHRLGQLGPQLQRPPREQGVPGQEFLKVGVVEPEIPEAVERAPLG